MSLRAGETRFRLGRSSLLYPADCFAQIARNDSTHFAVPTDGGAPTSVRVAYPLYLPRK